MKRRGLVSSFGFALEGIGYVLRTQRNFRIQLILGVIALALGVALRFSALEFAVLLVTTTAVLVAEMANTVVEVLVDLLTAEYHPLAKIAKDVAAGAVLLLAISAVLVGLLLFIPHLPRL